MLIATIVVRLIFKALKPRDGSLAQPWPLEAKRTVMSERERALYQRLVEELPNHIVMAQAQLLQLLKFKRGQRTYAIFNRISQLSLDFVVLKRDTSILAAIELDDATHNAKQPRLRRATGVVSAQPVRLLNSRGRAPSGFCGILQQNSNTRHSRQALAFYAARLN